MNLRNKKKILIIGCCGAGKSLFAYNLSRALKLPLVGLDSLYWQPGWKRTERNEWRKIVTDLVKRDKWVMDGNYRNTFDIRFKNADLIIHLDLPRFICLWRAIKRRLLKNRCDKLDKCNERLTFELIKWILWDYRIKHTKDNEKYFSRYQDKTIHLRSRGDYKKFFAFL